MPQKAGQARPAYMLYQMLWRALDLLYPPSCVGCGKVGARWCISCQKQIAPLTGPLCPRCGDPRVQPGLCPDCQSTPPYYQSLRSFTPFDSSIREALHRLKYQRDIGLGEALSKHLIELYNDLKWDVDLVAPVPLSQHRIRERGYNQSDFLARPLAYAIDKPYRPGVVRRTRETQSQVGLSAKERQKNVEGAFMAQARHVKGKTILIVDDVTTTGATLSACAQALCDAGASAVFGLTLARAILG